MSPWMRLGLLGLWGAGAGAALAAAPERCVRHSPPQLPTLVELYTSEGCNSCPPADRWLSSLGERSDVVRLAFHVDYWDALGWKDRYASAAHTARQYAQQGPSGARFVYTPQVLVNGRDHRGATLPAPATAPRPEGPRVTLAREAEAYVARVEQPQALGAKVWKGYWALTEDAHSSAVRAGENQGVTLHHDAVVRQYQPFALDAAHPQPLPFKPNTQAAPEHPRRVVLVIQDPDTQRPVEVVSLAC